MKQPLYAPDSVLAEQEIPAAEDRAAAEDVIAEAKALIDHKP
jgi:hypothetical protein